MDRTAKSKLPGITWPENECSDGHVLTAPVASFKPNAFGLYDMIGNVMEFTLDCSNTTYAGAPSDGSAWMSGDCSSIRFAAPFGRKTPHLRGRQGEWGSMRRSRGAPKAFGWFARWTTELRRCGETAVWAVEVAAKP